MVKRLLVIATAVAALVFVALPAAAQGGPPPHTVPPATPGHPGYGPGGPHLNCTPPVQNHGKQVNCELRGYSTNTTYTADFHSVTVVLGTGTTDSAGAGAFSFAVPDSAAPGQHTVVVTDANGNTASATITVPGANVSGAGGGAVSGGAAGGGGGGGLAFTGAEIGLMTGGAALLLAIGGLTLLASRKRAHA